MKILISSLQDSFLCLVLVISFYIGSFIIYFAFSTHYSNWFSLYCILPYLITFFSFMFLKDRILPGNYSFEKNFKKD